MNADEKARLNADEKSRLNADEKARLNAAEKARLNPEAGANGTLSSTPAASSGSGSGANDPTLRSVQKELGPGMHLVVDHLVVDPVSGGSRRKRRNKKKKKKQTRRRQQKKTKKKRKNKNIFK